MTNPKKPEPEKGGFSPVAAAVAGAVVGAGVAAGAVVLSDEENRKKISDVLSNAKEKAADYVEDTQKKIENA